MAAAAGTVLMAALTVLVGAQVAARYLFGAPIIWAEELASLCFLWLVYLGSVVLYKRKGHIAVTALSNKFPAAIQKKVEKLINICSAGFFTAVIYLSLTLQEILLQHPSVTLEIPKNVNSAALIFCGAALVVVAVDSTLRPPETGASSEA